MRIPKDVVLPAAPLADGYFYFFIILLFFQILPAAPLADGARLALMH